MRKEFARYVSLNILGMLGLSCYILADTFFIAQWLGANGLAALNIAIPVYSIMYGSGLMLGMGGGVRFTLRRAAGEQELADRSFTLAICTGAVFSAVFVLLGLFASAPIAHFLGADEATFGMTRTYLRTLLLCSPVFALNNILLSFVRNDGAPGRAMAAMLTGSFSNILLDYVFVFLLQLGMFGAVLATCMAPLISIIVLSPYFIRRQNSFHLTHISPQQELRECGRMLAVGAPAFITELSNAAVILIFNLLMLRFAGNTGVAAYGIIANISLVVVAIFNGIAQGMQPLVSRCSGRGEHNELHKLLRYALITAAVLFAAVYAAIYLGTSRIAALFNSESDPTLQTLAEQGLRLYFTGAGFAGLNIIASVTLAAAEHPVQGNVISLLRGLVLIIPLSFLTAALWQVTGVWLTFPITELLTGVFSTVFLAGLYRHQ